ncbi:MAG: hypothetical protein AB7Q17_11070 [Phycisphaerae bacterium]
MSGTSPERADFEKPTADAGGGPPAAPASSAPQPGAPWSSGARRAAAPAGGGALAAIGNLLRYPLMPLLWLARLMVVRVGVKQGSQVVTFTSFSSLIYVWPIVVVGYFLLGLHWLGWGDPGVLGWIWLFTIVFVLIVMGSDISRDTGLVWILVAALILTLGALLNARFQLPVLGWLYGHFSSLGVAIDGGTVRALCELLLILLAVVVVHSLFDGRHEISSREVTHRRMLRASENLPLYSNRVRLDWPDLLEMIALFGAGHLVVIDQDRKEVMRIPNIPCLWFFRAEINGILDVMATTEVVGAPGKIVGAEE